MTCNVILLFCLSLESAKLLGRPFEGVISLTTVHVYAVLLPIYFCTTLSTQSLLYVHLCIPSYPESRAADSMFNLYMEY